MGLDQGSLLLHPQHADQSHVGEGGHPGTNLSLQVRFGLRVRGRRGAPAPALAAPLLHGLVVLPELLPAAAAALSLPVLRALPPPLLLLLLLLAQPPQLLLLLPPPACLQLAPPLLVPPLPLTDAVHLIAVTARGDRHQAPLATALPLRPRGSHTHLSLLEVDGGRSGFGFRPRGLGGGFSATEEGARWSAASSPGQRAPAGRALPGFLPRGGFLTETSESESEEDEEDEEEDADLAAGSVPSLAPSEPALESESEADGTLRVRGQGGDAR